MVCAQCPTMELNEDSGVVKYCFSGAEPSFTCEDCLNRFVGNRGCQKREELIECRESFWLGRRPTSCSGEYEADRNALPASCHNKLVCDQDEDTLRTIACKSGFCPKCVKGLAATGFCKVLKQCANVVEKEKTQCSTKIFEAYPMVCDECPGMEWGEDSGAVKYCFSGAEPNLFEVSAKRGVARMAMVGGAIGGVSGSLLMFFVMVLGRRTPVETLLG